MTRQRREPLDQPSISTDNKGIGHDFALGEGPGRVSRGPVHIHPLPRVVQGVDYRRRRRTDKRPSAGAGSGGFARHQCRYVRLSGITTTVRPPHSPQTARTAAYHWPLCSIGAWAHGGGTATAKRSIIPTISTNETDASSSYEGIGPHYALH